MGCRPFIRHWSGHKRPALVLELSEGDLAIEAIVGDVDAIFVIDFEEVDFLALARDFTVDVFESLEVMEILHEVIART